MEEIKTALLQLGSLLIGYFLTLIAAEVKGWIAKKKQQEEYKAINERLKANEAIVKIAVKAVEQGIVELKGAEKFEAAKDKVIARLRQKGLPIVEEEVDDLIEAFVHEMNQIAKVATSETKKP